MTILHPGGEPPHACEQPDVDLTTSHGCVWRCWCGRRWRLFVTVIWPRTSWRGEWRRWPWPLPALGGRRYAP